VITKCLFQVHDSWPVQGEMFGPAVVVIVRWQQLCGQLCQKESLFDGALALKKHCCQSELKHSETSLVYIARHTTDYV
jgi:hypothetical protein